MDELFNNGSLDFIVLGLTGRMCLVAGALGVFFFLLSLAWNYISTAVKNLDDKNTFHTFRATEILRTIVILFMIVLYVPIMGSIYHIANMVNKVTLADEKSFQEWEKGTEILENQFINYLNTNDVNKLEYVANHPDADEQKKHIARAKLDEMEHGTDNTQRSFIGQTWEDMKEGFDMKSVITLIFSFIGDMARSIILFLMTGLLKVLFVIGPLSLAFSILPMFRSNLDLWFGSFMVVLFSFVTINIIDIIANVSMLKLNSIAALEQDLSNTGLRQYLPEEMQGKMDTLMSLNMACSILYMTVFWLTSRFVGKNDGGGVIGKAISTGMIVTGMALGAVGAGGIGKAAGGKSGGGGIANTIIKEASEAGKKLSKET